MSNNRGCVPNKTLYVLHENVPLWIKTQHERQIDPGEFDCIARCMLLGVKNIAEEKAIEKAAEKAGPRIFYSIADNRFKLLASSSKVLVPKLAAEIGMACNPFSAALKLDAAFQAYECTLVCKGWEKRCVKKESSEKK